MVFAPATEGSGRGALGSLHHAIGAYNSVSSHHARGARGKAKLNRTLGQSPRHRLASLGNTKKKNVPCFSDFRGGGFFLKWKGHFSFWCSARKDIRTVWQGFNSDSVLPKLFSGGLDFRKTETNVFEIQRGFGFGFRPQKEIRYEKKSSNFSKTCILSCFSLYTK